jgi:hypothetical protein
VYNGKFFRVVENRFLKSDNYVNNAKYLLKPKNSEGHDRLPPRMLYNAHDFLSSPFTKLFPKVMNNKRSLINGRCLKFYQFSKRD